MSRATTPASVAVRDDQQPGLPVQVGAAERLPRTPASPAPASQRWRRPAHHRCRRWPAPAGRTAARRSGHRVPRSPCAGLSAARCDPTRGLAPSLFDAPGVDLADRHPGQTGHLAGMRRQDAAGGSRPGQSGSFARRFSASASTTTRPCHSSFGRPSPEKSVSTKSRASSVLVKPGPDQQRIVTHPCRAASFAAPAAVCTPSGPGQGQPGHFGQDAGQHRVQRHGDRQRDQARARPRGGRAAQIGRAGVVERAAGDHRLAEGAFVRIHRPRRQPPLTSSGPISSSLAISGDQLLRHADIGDREQAAGAGARGYWSCPHFGQPNVTVDRGGDRGRVQRAGVAIQPAGAIHRQDRRMRATAASRRSSSSQSSSHASSSSSSSNTRPGMPSASRGPTLRRSRSPGRTDRHRQNSAARGPGRRGCAQADTLP